ncbi:tripartite tricarboxylate transporter TctB family protein [uncultured Jannaschia sp.]|uniref:tripartite tricarboxylate transporter TctB family protein n=1 Tax=uncultured Jannaschia sp. TaxID=293347 RepID=UPI002636B33F|nr:tripartite tricarboxylate transporter TctB family protein [uncultured Jannaschia sp.]
MLMAKADRYTAVALLALGAAMLAGGWTMDRLEIRQIHPASIPGLVPMILGGLLAVCAGLLFRASYADAKRGPEAIMVGGSWSRLGITTATCLVYALVLIGWASYFWATAIFTAVFALLFSYPAGGSSREKAIAVAGAVMLGFGIGFGSALLFERLFLVRLP